MVRALAPRFMVVAATFAAVTALSLAAVGFAAASSTPGLDNAVLATLVFPSSTKMIGGGSPAGHGANSIEIYSWNWGVSQSNNSVGAGGISKTGRASVHDLVVTKSTDQSTPSLWRACASGQHYATLLLYLDEPTPANPGTAAIYSAYMTITMKNAYIVSDTLEGTVGAGSQSTPKETVTIAFAHSSMTWTQGGKTAIDAWQSR